MSSLTLRTITKWQYDDPAARARELAERAAKLSVPIQPPGFTEDEVASRIAASLAEAEGRWKAQADAHERARTAQISAAIESFAKERTAYFRQVESEVVQLSLAIARKILEREAELDPTLLSGLVRIALDRMGAGAAVRLRVPTGEELKWRGNEATGRLCPQWEIVVDDTLQPGDCVVETDLGSAHFGFEAQLREVEASLLGILAQRPDPLPSPTLAAN